MAGTAMIKKKRRKKRIPGIFLIFVPLVALSFSGCGSLSFKDPEELPGWEDVGKESGEDQDEHVSGTESKASDENGEKGGEEGSEGSSGEDEAGPLEDGSTLTEGYAGSTLDDEGRDVYRTILESLVERREVDLSTTDTAVVDRAYTAVMADHPEIFYTNGYTCTSRSLAGTVIRLSFAGNYTCTRSEEESYQKAIDAAAQEALSGMEGMSEYEKVRSVYEYVIDHTEYDADAENGQNIVSVFVNGRSVCTGYAKAAQYLLGKLGMASVLVTGTARGGRHAWDKVLSDGAWYNVDTTWGDASFLGGNDPWWINYDYLLVTDEDINKTHTTDDTIIFPACTKRDDNYYVREGLWFDTWDEEHFRKAADAALSGEENVIRIRCDSDAVYSEMMEELITNQRIYDFLPGVTSIRYTTDAGLHTLTVIL